MDFKTADSSDAVPEVTIEIDDIDKKSCAEPIDN